MKTNDLAKAFIEGKSGTCHNATTDGENYYLHGHRIAWKKNTFVFGDWCGYHTRTTANHLKHIAKHCGGRASGYAMARAKNIGQFVMGEERP